MKINKIREDIKYVSFDIFDTLIKRDVMHPTDVFELTDRTIQKEQRIENFKKVRRTAEVDLYPKKKYEEITLQEIYDNFPSDIPSDLKRRYMEKEQEVEIEICTFNESMRSFYEQVLNSGKKIIIATDMYLPKTVIEKILAKNEIRYDYLFVSSELRLKKKTGNMFAYIKQQLNSSGKDILHIGDNLESDYLKPKQLGIHAKKIKKDVFHTKYATCNNMSEAYSYLYAFLNNRILGIENEYERLGFETLGPLLFGFCKWIKKNIEEQKIQHILFLARDGKIMKKAYDILYEQDDTTYFYASRRALIIPNLCHYHTVEEIFQNFALPKRIKIEALIKKVGLECDENVISQLAKYHLAKEEDIDTEQIQDKESAIYQFLNSIMEWIKNNSLEERKNEMLYFQDKLTKMKHKKVALVDIGWYGNMQNNFEDSAQSFQLEAIYGYYIGLVPRFSNTRDKNMLGFLFHTDDQDFENYIREKNYNSLFELFFSADHGSVKKYINEKEVELQELEYDVEQCKKIEWVQKGALAFIKAIQQSIIRDIITCSPDEYSYAIHELGNNPTYQDAKTLGALLFYDNDIAKLSNFDSRTKYLFHPKMMFKKFTRSQWKIAFLKQLFVIKLPYEKICRKLRGGNIR